jgi:hypothetical protein
MIPTVANVAKHQAFVDFSEFGGPRLNLAYPRLFAVAVVKCKVFRKKQTGYRATAAFASPLNLDFTCTRSGMAMPTTLSPKINTGYWPTAANISFYTAELRGKFFMFSSRFFIRH